MVWVMVGVGLLIATILGGRAFVNADPSKVARAIKMLGAIAAGLVGLVLTVRGGAAIGVPMLLFAFGALVRMGTASGAGGRVSTVETATVRMTLDHDTGRMDGELLQGPFAGQRLSDLERDDVEACLADAVGDDPDGAALLRTYLERRFGGAGGGSGFDAGSGGAGPDPDPYQAGAGSTGGPMSVEEALSVLGLAPDASDDDVRAAHRRLMMKAHPDQGGSDWLAAKINRAKEVLLPNG